MKRAIAWYVLAACMLLGTVPYYLRMYERLDVHQWTAIVLFFIALGALFGGIALKDWWERRA